MVDISTGERTVAIFDILGVKEDILAGKSADLIKRYRDRVAQIEQLRAFEYPEPNIPRLFPLGARERVRPSLHIFSDTLILIAPDDTVLIESWRLMQSFMTGRLPLRGGIAHDEMHIDAANRLHVGLALTAAYLLEASQAWAGCVIDDSVIKRLPEDPWAPQGYHGVFDRIFPWYDVPFKDSRIGLKVERRRTVNWRCNLVFDRGFGRDFKETHDVQAVEDLHPYLQRALEYGRLNRSYLEPGEAIPVECRVHWVGDNEPPFENGDEY